MAFQRLTLKLVSGLFFVVIACIVVSLLGYKTFEGFREGNDRRKARVAAAERNAGTGPSTASRRNRSGNVSMAAPV